jgi:O-antigen/teichoic acid export membrane protein
MPYLTTYMSTAEFGLYYMFMAIFNILTILCSANIHVSLTVNYFKMSSAEFQSFFCTILVVPPVIFFFLSIFVFSFSSSLEDLLKVDLYLLFIALLSALFNSYILFCLSFFQASMKPKMYFLLRFFQTLLDIILAISFVYFYKSSLEGRVESHLLTILFSSLFALIIVYRLGLIIRSFNLSYVKKALAFGLPLVPHTLSGLLIMNIDRVMLSNYQDLTSTGLFSSAIIISSIMMLIIEPVNKVFGPWLLSNLKDSNEYSKKRIVKITYALVSSFFVLVFILYLLKDLLYFILVDQMHYGTKEFIIYLFFGFCFQGMYYLVTNYLLFAEKTKVLSAISILTAILGCIYSYVFITHFGLLGASISFLLTNITLFILVWYFSNKYYPMPWFYFLKV